MSEDRPTVFVPSGSRRSVRAKFAVPELNRWVVPRPRLRSRLWRLRSDHQVVWVIGSAGSGKTTAVVDAVTTAAGGQGSSVAAGTDHTPYPVAWLTLDSSDTAPGRLLAHLEESLGSAFAGMDRAATVAMAAEMSHVEAGSLLGSAVPHLDATVVLDEVEHLVDSPAAVLAITAFLRSAPSTLRTVLITRRTVPLRLGGTLAVGGVGRIGERDLALDIDEAAQVLNGLALSHVDPGEAVRATGGWMAGVLFEAWRLPDHVHGDGGESDALSSYLATEILGDLSPEQQWFLLATSVLDSVTAEAATALGVPDAGTLLASFADLFLPLWTADDAGELRCHPRFRQYLRARLDESPQHAADVHRSHAALLVRDDRVEDGVEASLAAGDLTEAARTAERAVPLALDRGDVGLVATWLGRLRPADVQASPVLTRGELLVAIDEERWRTGAAVADRLLDLVSAGGRAQPMEPRLAGAVAACFVHVGRRRDAVAAIDAARPGPDRDTWQLMLAMDATDAQTHYRDRPDDCGEVVDGMLHRQDLIHGRLGRLVDLPPAPWAASRSSRVAALRAAGRLTEAEEILGDGVGTEHSPALSRIRIELLVDLGRPDEAFRELDTAEHVAERSSSYCMQLHHLLDASLSLRVRRDVGRARRALAKVENDPTARQHRRVHEQMSLWRGLAALLTHDDDAAVDHLTSALEEMIRWDRQLLVPAAGVYLAEAAWRVGLEEVADRAVDAALHASGVQGYSHLLLQALREFPLVLSRRLDADLDPHPEWQRLGRLLLDDSVVGRQVTRSGCGPRVRIDEFGVPTVELDGAAVDPRLTRSLDVLAYLATHRGTVLKSDVLTDVFEGRTDDSARAYLRVALARLRTALGAPCIEADGPHLRWTYGSLVSAAGEFESAARAASGLRGRARLTACLGALGMVTGPYLPHRTATWAEERRSQLSIRCADLRQDAAGTALQAGDLLTARDQLDQLLRDFPYREQAWQLAMRVASSLGQDDRVIDLFRSCRARLAEVPARPSTATTRLLDQLRR